MPVFGGSAATAAVGAGTGIRDNPYLGCNFLVEIQGLIAGGFSRVTGLDVTTDVEEIRQGGNNSYAHKLPRATSYADLQLVRGLGDVDSLWSWYQDVVAGKIRRRNGTIYLLSHAGVPTMWWNFVNAYPIRWSGPEFDAETNMVLSTAVTLVHDGLSNPAGRLTGSLGVLS